MEFSSCRLRNSDFFGFYWLFHSAPREGGSLPTGVCQLQIDTRSKDPFGERVQSSRKERLLCLQEVLHRVGYKRSRFLDLVRQGVFPEPVKLGARAVAWPESQIDEPVNRLAAGMGACHE
ncbi:MAG: helix-turn-helix transcriptional regulator [Solidesulfovibrio sp.]